jgi:hypothetical protein
MPIRTRPSSRSNRYSSAHPAITAMRGPQRRAALDTMKMRFDVPDAAPTDRLNRILWGW